jgi:uncharacterized lipoprotein YmbA
VKGRATAIATLCAVVLSAGCANPSPPAHFYALRPVATASAAPASGNTSVLVGPVSIPAIVDMPQIVVRVGSNQVFRDEFNRWAAPLQDNVSRVVAENLVATLGTPRVWLLQHSLNADADYRVVIEIQDFESAPGESVALDAVWIVRRVKDGASQTGRTTVRDPLTEKGYDALVGAHSRTIARLSQNISEAIVALDRSTP